MQAGLLKVGNDYINPNYITHIGKNDDNTTYVGYSVIAQGQNGMGPLSDRIPVDSDKFAQCLNKAMQTGQIVDVFV